METINLDLTKIFVKVARFSSFTLAAENLGLPKSTVSKAVTRLERETGTKLIVRTTRRLTLTAAGRAYYDSCTGPIQILEDAHKSLRGRDTMLSGVIKLTAPEDLGSAVISPALARLAQSHAGLAFNLVYTDEIVDLVEEGFDLAFRIGKLSESSLKARRIGEIVLTLVASPDYIKRAGKLQHPSDLKNHSCLGINARRFEWQLKSGREKADIVIAPRISSNQMSSLLQAAIAGAGIALVPHFLSRVARDDGLVVPVLPDWKSTAFTVSLVSPLPLSSSARIKVTADHLYGEVQRALLGEQ